MRRIVVAAVCLAVSALALGRESTAQESLAQEHGEEGITLNLPDKLKWQAGPPSLPKGAEIGRKEKGTF